MKSGNFAANLHLVGFKRSDPFARRLRRLKDLNKRKNVLYQGMANAARPMRDDMEASAPVKTGVLSQSFRIRKLKKTPQYVFGIRVGAVSGPRVVSPGMLDNAKIDKYDEGDVFNMAGWRDHFAELGTVRHGPTPHIAPAIQKNLGRYQKEVRKEIYKAIARLDSKKK